MIFCKCSSTHLTEHRGHKDLSLQTAIGEYLKPEFIYIPLVEGDVCEAQVVVGDYVKLGQVVALKKGRWELPLHSSVSGEVTSVTKKMWHPSGVMVNMIEIKNDFQETPHETIKANDVASLTPQQMIEIVKNCGVVGLGGSGFPTYVKYSAPCPIETIIVNAVECEPYLTADYVVLKEKVDVLIRGITYALKMSGAKKAYICIKKNKLEVIELIKAHLAPNIELFLVNDVYPAGWEKYLVQRVLKRTYNNLPNEVGAIVNNSSTMIAIAEAIEQNLPLIERVATFTGQGLLNPQNVRLKIGVVANEVINYIGGYKPEIEEANFILGGPMTGRSVFFDSVVINRPFGGLIVLPVTPQAPTLPCLGCGKCIEVCPVNLSPILIKEAGDNKDKDLMTALKADKCMLCGLCSYICPSRIELTEAVSKARELVIKGR